MIRALLFLIPIAAHAETCTYAGETSYRGHATATVRVTEVGSTTTVHVLARLDASPWRLWSVQFLAEEITTWEAGVLRSIAVNSRFVSGGSIRRQQWDVFVPGPAGLQASRVQSKRAAEFQRRHPGFAAQWELARFGQPWTREFPAAVPERRPDLDLPNPAATVRTPFALAFHWSRRLPPGDSTIPVFLPGWKRDALVDERVTHSGTAWRLAVQHPALGVGPSWIEATIGPGRTLARLRFDVRSPLGDGEGWMAPTGCRPD